MSTRSRCLVIALIVGAVAVSGCTSGSPAPAAKAEAAKVEPVAGTTMKRLTLTPRAVERLGIQTVEVRSFAGSGIGGGRTTVPYGAVLYDAHGATWTYTSPEPQVFLRHEITIDYIGGDEAVLTKGPPAGTRVVTVGAAELFGTEFDVGH